MFTLWGDVFNVVKTSENIWKQCRRLSKVTKRVALTSQLCSLYSASLDHQMVPQRHNGRFVGRRHRYSCFFLPSVLWWRLLSTFRPATWPMCHNCLNTSCCTEELQLGGWIQGVLSCIMGVGGDMEGRPQHRGVKSDAICGKEWVRLFSCVDILRCFLVVLLCVSSVCIFFLN